MKSIFIGKKKVNYGLRPFIVAEAGVNHNARLDLALQLIDAAAYAGADAVKFQTFRPNQVVTAAGEMADYQKRNLGKSESQLAMVKKLELAEKHWPKLVERAKEPAFKFGSGDLTNIPLLEYVAKFKKPMILGTGMSNLEEVKEAVSAIKKAGNSQIVVLHCTTDYPLAPENVNLRAMQTLMKELGVLVGYSDHTLGPQTAVMATAMGACMIEKHLTLDNNLPGPDHVASMEPMEFKEMVKQIEKAAAILGSSQKKLLKCEKQYVSVARKSLVTANKVKKGEKFTLKNLTVKRPGNGLLPKRLKEVVGKRATKAIPKDTVLTEEMIG